MSPDDISPRRITHLKRLEAESIHIFREVAAEFQNPVMLYSIGKDSTVMLRLAQKAFHPAPLPFPLLHIDTTWNPCAMYTFRDELVAKHGFDLRVHVNRRALDEGMNPFDYTTQQWTNAMLTQSVVAALRDGSYDAAFGGARRDEEKSRAKERVYSFRDEGGQWDPKSQRPELWNLYNGRIDHQKGESIRVFPLSNWTELDVWQYIWLEDIPIVPIYFASERDVIVRDGQIIVVDDERMRLRPGEQVERRRVRYRTLGDYPLSAAIESDATTLPAIIREMLQTRSSERQGRLIDHDEDASMELKKREGYF